jgi:SPFH domain / Band 7 family
VGVEDLILPAAVGGGVLAAAGFAVWSFYSRFYVAVPPNQALVMYGARADRPRGVRRGSSEIVTVQSPRIVVGGGKFVGPWAKGVGYLSLDLVSVDVPVRATGMGSDKPGCGWEARVGVQVKIPSEPQALVTAAEHLFGKTTEEIRTLVRHAVEGIAPAVLFRLRSTEGRIDLEHVAAELQAALGPDLIANGLSVQSLTIRELRQVRADVLPLPPMIEAKASLVPDPHPTPGDARAWLAGVDFRLARVERSLGIMGAEIVRMAREGSSTSLDAGSVPVFDYPLGSVVGTEELSIDPSPDPSHDSIEDDHPLRTPRASPRGARGTSEGGGRSPSDSERG